MRRIFGFFIGATIGGMVGATLALLFAPASGQKLRAQINDRSRPLLQKYARQPAPGG